MKRFLISCVLLSLSGVANAQFHDTRTITEIDTDACEVTLDGGDSYSVDECDALANFAVGDDVTVTTSRNGYAWMSNDSDEVQLSN